MDWDQYFMSMAYLVAMKSKDPSTKVGTVIVDDDHEVLATGYNNFPRGFDDSPERYQNKELKLRTIVHAETNACMSAARKGMSLKGGRAYVTWCPCEKCALALIQSGVKEVITHKENPVPASWNDATTFAKGLLSEAGVVYREWSGTLVTPVIFTGGKVVENPLDK